MSEAVSSFHRRKFEFIILDMMMPAYDGATASSLAGVELLLQLRKDRCLNRNTATFALSAYPDEIADMRHHFDKHGVLIVPFDASGAWKIALQESLTFSIAISGRRIRVGFVIYCALRKEADAVFIAGFEEGKVVLLNGMKVRYAKHPRHSWGVVIEGSQMGLVASTNQITTAIQTFESAIFCMSGICAGFSEEVALGQLVVASPCWEYQAGKWSDNDFEIAPMQIPLRAPTRGLIDQIISRPNLIQELELGLPRNLLRPPKSSDPALCPFVSGSAVIADEKRLSHIEKQHRKLGGLDMEAFGLYFSCHESSCYIEHYFAVKCVVDFADGGKNNDIHDYGCFIAAKALLLLIDGLAC